MSPADMLFWILALIFMLIAALPDIAKHVSVVNFFYLSLACIIATVLVN